MISNTNIVDLLFHFMIFFVIFIIVLEMILSLVLRNRKSIQGIQMRLFGLLLELSNTSILSISILMVRYLFLFFSLFSRSSITIVHLLIFVGLSILYSLSTRSFKNFILEIISSGAMYFALICSHLLRSYLVEVRPLWYVSLGNILFIMFLLIYATFFLLKGVNEVVSQSKYVRRKRNEDN